ncbi:hypothetical protein [Nostoc sp. T09]|uniref:hypothetical protein n=1 Tax=Nostoc sp. T09 TaxID=1932621 RepID=UPI001C4E35E4|nr:hypothetical protein [Nostoc sp. T09]
MYYYVSLNNKWGSIRLTQHEFNNEKEQKNHAAKINHFIHNSNEQYLNLQQKFKQEKLTFMSIFFLVIVSICGLIIIAVPLTIMSFAMLYALRGTTCTFDKVAGMMILKHEALRNTFEPIVIQCPIEEITDIQIKAFYGRGNTWKIELILEKSPPISLNWMETPDKQEKIAAADCIRKFLNLQNF